MRRYICYGGPLDGQLRASHPDGTLHAIETEPQVSSFRDLAGNEHRVVTETTRIAHYYLTHDPEAGHYYWRYAG